MNTAVLSALYTYGPFVFLAIVFYFFLYRPQKKQQKAREALIESLKVGNRVLSIGGIYGEITYVNLEKSDFIKLKVADNLEIKMSATSIVRNLTKEKNELTQEN